MKIMMKSHAFWRLTALVALLCACGGSLRAQSQWTQEDACPGWNNPQNFEAGDGANFYYQARLGKKIKNGSTGIAPNMTTGETGYASEDTYSGSASVAQGTWDTIHMIPDSRWPNVTIGNATISTGYDNAAFPTGFSQNNAFAIYSYNTPNAVSGGPVGMDANTGNGLPYVPTSFNTNDSNLITPEGNYNTHMERSIRIGDASGGTNATAIYYNLVPNGDNAMFFIYYACVIPKPSGYTHGISCDPAFIIRVCKQNAQGKWVSVSPYRDSDDPLQAPNNPPYDDALAYAVPSTLAPSQTDGAAGGTVVPGQDGWHRISINPQGNSSGSRPFDMLWKEWSKVSLNLSNFYGEHIRIEVMVSDCCQNQHFAYAYVAGECRPMTLASSGCPAGRDTNVTVLSAPVGLQSYVWYASDFGKGTCPQPNPQFLNAGGSYDYYTWRRLNTDSTAADAYRHNVSSRDFKVTKRGTRNNVQMVLGDSTGTTQYFRCKMVSALNPARPIVSYLYTSVTNSKPTMAIDTLSLCGGDVRLWNRSFVPGGSDADVDLAGTTWTFYNNPNALGTPDSTATGDSVTIHYNDGNRRSVVVRTDHSFDQNNPNAGECYSEATYTFTPLMNPTARMTITDTVLCDTSSATFIDVSEGVTYRRWSFLDEDAPDDDTTQLVVYPNEGPATENNQSVTRSFTHPVEPVELYVRNGLYYVNRANTAETTWCSDVARREVRVFTNPELTVTGIDTPEPDTIVCQGSLTNVSVHAVGVDGCQYQWSTSEGAITGGLPAGPNLQVAPQAPTETYYVRVISPQGCEAWGSIRVHLVKPTLSMVPGNGLICPGEEVTLLAENAHHYSWVSVPEDTTLTNSDTNLIHVRPSETTTYIMYGYGSNNCRADSLTKTVTVLPKPIPHVSYEPTIVDVDDPTVVLRNQSENSVRAEWEFANGEMAVGDEVTHTFVEATGANMVYVTLIPYNELDCPEEYRFGIPVRLYTMWYPNIFTPNSEDENSYFRMYTAVSGEEGSYEVYRLYIYNRRGEVVFETNDPEFVWDGTCNGVACPQGTYVYVCRYRKPGILTLSEQRGTVTLVR